MAFRVRLNCFICNNLSNPQIMSRMGGENNALKRELAINRRDQAGRPAMEITNETRICNTCNFSICQEIRILENDPTCIRLNVLTQTSSHTCLICNAPQNIHRLTLRCRIDIFVNKNIYIPENCLCCNRHLDDNKLLLKNLQEGLRFINRPYIFRGSQLLSFLNGFRS